jgi:hypothetical protein
VPDSPTSRTAATTYHAPEATGREDRRRNEPLAEPPALEVASFVDRLTEMRVLQELIETAIEDLERRFPGITDAPASRAPDPRRLRSPRAPLRATRRRRVSAQLSRPFRRRRRWGNPSRRAIR